MNSLSEKDLEDAAEYDSAMKIHVDHCFGESLRHKAADQEACVAAAKVLDDRPTTVITDAHDTYIKLLAYAGPPPHDNMHRGVTVFSRYVPWVRYVAVGIRTLFPGIEQKQVYEKTVMFADWCRQQRRK